MLFSVKSVNHVQILQDFWNKGTKKSEVLLLGDVTGAAAQTAGLCSGRIGSTQASPHLQA